MTVNVTVGVLCPRTEKTLLLRKAKELQAAVNREKVETDNILFNNLSFRYFCVASCNNNAKFV